MKKIYESPVFKAEAYSFSDSIAKCEFSVDPNKPITVNLGDCVCKIGDGHKYKATSYVYENYQLDSFTLFNDGEKTDCFFDWAGPGTNVVQTERSFADSFYANSANDSVHSPAYEGKALFS